MCRVPGALPPNGHISGSSDDALPRYPLCQDTFAGALVSEALPRRVSAGWPGTPLQGSLTSPFEDRQAQRALKYCDICSPFPCRASQALKLLASPIVTGGYYTSSILRCPVLAAPLFDDF